MHSLRRIVLLTFVLGALFSFVGLRSSAQPVRADNVATAQCDSGNSSFQICSVTLNVQVGPSGSFTATLLISSAQILSCGSVPAGMPCNHTLNQAVFQCPGGCAAGSQWQIVLAGPAGAGNQLAFALLMGGLISPSYGSYAPSYGSYAPSYGSYAPSYGSYAPTYLPYAASYYTYSRCGYTVAACGATCAFSFSYSCFSPNQSACTFFVSFCGSTCFGFTTAFCPGNCTFGLLCNTANLCFAIGASCAITSTTSCFQFTLFGTTFTSKNGTTMAGGTCP